MGRELHPTIKAWLTRAKHDLDTAKFVSASQQDLLDTAICHCQQAAEKALKAMLIHQGESVPRTHDLGVLILLGTALVPQIVELTSLAALLSPLATEFRYPADDEAPMPTQEQFDEALAAAQRIFNFVLSLLPSETHPL